MTNHLHGVVDKGSKAVLHVGLQNISIDGIVLGDLVISVNIVAGVYRDAVRPTSFYFEVNFFPKNITPAGRKGVLPRFSQFL